MPRIILSGLLALLFVYTSVAAADGTRMLRYPDIHGDRVVFTYAGDLWLAPLDNSEPARRLTSHPGLEQYAKFSPDGSQVAFTGQYQGDDQVYVIDVDGGAPQQLTYYPAAGPLPARWGTEHQVYGWTPDGENVLFRSLRHAAKDRRLFTVSSSGGLPEALPMPRGGSGDYSPDGSSILYSPLFRDFRTWKRYQGGWAQNLYVYDLENNTASQVTSDARTERDPIWQESGMYFVSDQTGTLNLYRLGDDGSWQAITDEDTWDIKWASGDKGSRIVYEVEGLIGLYDAASDTNTRLTINVPDDEVRRMARRINVKDNLEDFGLSPAGERAVVTARGDVFSVPVEHGVTRNLTQRGDAHDREAAWSPDGKLVAFISDRSGEEQIWVVDEMGGEARQLGEVPPARLYDLAWAPDSSAIAFYDHTGGIHVVDMSGDLTQVFQSKYGVETDYSWSPDSKWITFSAQQDTGNNALMVWSVEDEELTQITEGSFNEYSPAFSPDGKHLYYLSQREFAPQIGQFEWNYVGNRATGIFALALNSDAGNPFGPRNDEVAKEEGEDESDDNGDEEENNGDAVNIEFDGLANRVIRVPVDADNIQGVMPLEDRLLFATSGAFYYGRAPERQTVLHALSFKDRKVSEVASNVQNVSPSSDGKYLLVQSNGGLQRIASGDPSDAKPVSLSNLYVTREPSVEWEVIFDEVWRRFRDYFYVRNMHGYDWEAIGNQYRPLLEHVSTREDLNTLIGEMIAELNVGHAYIQGGDLQAGDRSSVALLGAQFEADERSGRYRVSHIYEGANAEPKYRSPANEVGVDLNVGDYIIAIDGRPLTTDQNPYALLTDRGNQPVELTVNDSADEDGARRILIDSISSEASLAYLEWVQGNNDYVSEQTDGRVGYLHVPNMGGDGIYEFIKWFYPQIRKQGLIVDVRSNGGGNVSQWLIRRLMQKPLGYGYQAHNEWAQPYPGTAFNGPMVSLINEDSASDGDIFPFYFREAGLGPLIGKLSWGGTVGITGRGPLLDGGNVFVPEFGTGGLNSNWVIEGSGVTPDIEVSNDPASSVDAQLDRGISEVLERIEAEQPFFPAHPGNIEKTQ